MSFEANELYEFGTFRADAVRRLLFRDGQPVALTSKAFDTLLVLIRNRGQVVEKDALLKAIWPNSFVEEANLAQNVSALRKALGESAGEHRYIATVPGRGYRFVADVRQIGAVETELAVERRTTAEVVVEEEFEQVEAKPAGRKAVPLRLVAGAGILLAVLAAAGWMLWKNQAGGRFGPGLRSIAVLPFQPLDVQEDKSLGLGLTDALITKLSNLHELVVRPTSAILRYGDPLADPWAAGHDLDVDSLVEGKVQKAGDRLRVTVQLLRVKDRKPIWAGAFDESFTNIFAMEDAISERIAQGLSVTLGQAEKQRLDRNYTANIEAYRNYLNGRYAEFRFTPDGLNQAIAYFNKAISIDPSYALAHAGLADAYTTASDWVLSPREALPKAEAAARHAVEFDDGLAAAHAALAHAEMHEWRLDEAGKEFARALALNPNITAIYFAYSEYLAALGKYDRSEAEIVKALKIDPLSAEMLFMRGFPIYLRHDYARSLAADTAAVQAYPDYWAPRMAVGYANIALRRFPAAIASFQKGRALAPDSTINLAGLAVAYAISGDRPAALNVLAQLQQMRTEHYVAPFDFAVVYCALGDRARALDSLDQAYADQSEMMLFLNAYQPVADLRNEPRFQALVRRVGAPANQ